MNQSQLEQIKKDCVDHHISEAEELMQSDLDKFGCNVAAYLWCRMQDGDGEEIENDSEYGEKLILFDINEYERERLGIEWTVGYLFMNFVQSGKVTAQAFF